MAVDVVWLVAGLRYVVLGSRGGKRLFKPSTVA